MTAAMQFRDFIFPNNPRSITVSAGEGTATLFCPGRGEIVQNLGGSCRIVRCEGSFFGDTFEQAATDLEGFRTACADGEAGLLFIPGLTAFRAHLREFAYSATGDGRILPYTMVFVEAEAGA